MYMCLNICNSFFSCRYTEGTELLDLCTLLDPRVKNLLYLSTEERIILQDRLLDICVNDCSTQVACKEQENLADANTKTSAPTPQHSGLADLLSGLYNDGGDGDASATQTAMVQADAVRFELKQFVKSADANMHTCPLMW